MNRLIYSICILFVCLQGQAQQTYEIKGYLKEGPQADSVFITHYNSSSRILAEAKVENHAFLIKGTIDRTILISIRVKGWRRREEIYLEPGNFEIQLSADYKQPNYIIGGVQNNIKKSYEGDLQSLNDSVQAIVSHYEKVNEDEKVIINEKLQHLNTKMDAVRMSYINCYPSSIAVLDMMRPYIDVMNFQQLSGLLDRFDKQLAYSPTYKLLEEAYRRRKKEQLVGRVAPEIESRQVNGERFKLSKLNGKLVLLDFWASWCAPCRLANKQLKPIYEKYRSKGFEIVSFSMDKNATLWKNAIQNDQIPWIQVSDLEDMQKNTTALNYRVKSLPTVYLINESGEVIAQNIGKEEIVKILEQHFSQ